ncbi:MAG: DUF2085 domain-containing protein [Thermoplasmata archaeon]|nr:DUF2085 domain-containing protein [Thermoplasmata archaeon]
MSLTEKLIQAIEHNPEHYIELTIRGKTIRPCARCLGKYLGMFLSLPIALLFFFGHISIPFTVAFIISWLLAIPAIFDWLTVKLNIRKGNNNIRFVTGFLLGAGITSYFIILPASLLFKISTFFVYSAIFAIIRIHFTVDGGIRAVIQKAKESIAYPKANIYSCGVETGCCCSLCNGCYGTCMNACLCTLVMLIALPMLCCSLKILCGGKKNDE